MLQAGIRAIINTYLADYAQYPKEMFRLNIDQNMCKGCGICVEFCPSKVYDLSEGLSKMGVRYPVPKRRERCTGCQLCEIMCPDMAIDVENDADEG